MRGEREEKEREGGWGWWWGGGRVRGKADERGWVREGDGRNEGEGEN